MGGLAPGIGGFELLLIALVALLVVGPKDLPLLLRKVGQAMGKARAMAAEFRASFDEMARQSELDELRKEVEALRTGQGVHKLGPEADAAFREIRDDLNRPLDVAGTPAAVEAPKAPEASAPSSELAAPETSPSAVPTPKPKVAAKRKANPTPARKPGATPRAASSKTPAARKPAARKPATRKPTSPRTPKS